MAKDTPQSLLEEAGMARRALGEQILTKRDCICSQCPACAVSAHSCQCFQEGTHSSHSVEVGIYGSGLDDGQVEYMMGRHPQPGSRYPCTAKDCPQCKEESDA